MQRESEKKTTVGTNMKQKKSVFKLNLNKLNFSMKRQSIQTEFFKILFLKKCSNISIQEKTENMNSLMTISEIESLI